MTEESSPAELPTPATPPSPDAASASPDAPADAVLAPPAPRLLPPSGVAKEPPWPVVVAQLPAAAGGGASYHDTRRPSFLFLTTVAVLSFLADIGSKTWAEKHLEGFPGNIPIWKDHIAFVLAKNKGGAWGLLQGANESVRRPFFLLVSVAAIAFIMTLYRKLQARQHALKWGLPLVLGGALGNVFDRIRYGSVIDFIDCHLFWGGHDHHWPTFNVADVAICVGVGLMALDMFTAGRYAPGGSARPGPLAGGGVHPAGSAGAGAVDRTEPTPPEPPAESGAAAPDLAPPPATGDLAPAGETKP